MASESDISPVAALLADPARAIIMNVLLDGRSMPAGELSRAAGVSAQTASGHLGKLLASGLLKVETQGRHRYYAIATAEVAHAIETLSSLAPPPKPKSLRQSLQMQRLSLARSCYDHLAGEIAVKIADSLVQNGQCERYESGFAVTQKGVELFRELQIGIEKPYTKSCIDWTVRRQHIAGPVGRALLRTMIDRGWIERNAEPRSLRVTDIGRGRLFDYFGVR